MFDSPNERRLFAVWIVLGLAAALLVGDGERDRALLPLAAGAWSAICTLGLKIGRLLLAARTGSIRVGTAPRTWSLWRRAGLAVLLGAMPGFFGTRLALRLDPATTRHLMQAILALSVPAAFLIVRAQFRIETRQVATPRKTSLVAWALVDTGLPAGLIAAAFGVAALWLKHGHREALPPAELARHLAISLVIYGACLGMAGFVKTRSERLGGLVEAPLMQSPSPGPVAIAGVAAVAMLALGPTLLPELGLEHALYLKSGFGLVFGGLFSTLGALKGARDPAAPDGPSRWGRKR